MAFTAFGALFFLGTAQAQAIPLFAQRYQLQCTTCHSVLPELNSFGVTFRRNGYRLAIPKHGTSGVAIRYQLQYQNEPAAGSRRFTPGGVLLSNADIGAVSAFIHYNLGAAGGPAALFLGYLATYNRHTQSLYRAGLIELPLLQSPGQRLDDLAPYGYYSTHAGLNDLSLSAPRWGLQLERVVGSTNLDVVLDTGEFKGAAYGGKPIATGVRTSADRPEVAAFAGTAIFENVDVSVGAIAGARRIAPVGRGSFADSYRRLQSGIHARWKKLDVQAEQWWGLDDNADGFGSALNSSGGYARLKYYPSRHLYVAARYDADAAPFAERALVLYAAGHVTPHARLLIERRQPLGGGRGVFGAALTVGFPWPSKL
ncbi:MAG: hypothetical protein M3126_02465 [Candidatus Eremiobacteraeota bacterium]|nr:hypothetical protein [Candidatus Eremiobacteraeota bacterium]